MLPVTASTAEQLFSLLCKLKHFFKVTGFVHATGPLVNNVNYVRSRAGVPVRFFHVKLDTYFLSYTDVGPERKKYRILPVS